MFLLLLSVSEQFCRLLVRRVSASCLVSLTSPVMMVTCGPRMLQDWAR